MFLFFLLGILTGSFLAALAKRIPINEPIIIDRSKCDHCQQTLKWFDLIPFLILIFNQNKCRYCQKNIAKYHSLFELLMGITFAIFFQQFSVQVNHLYLLILWAMGMTLSLTDYLYYLVEPKIMYSFGSIAFLCFIKIHPFSYNIFLTTIFVAFLFLLLTTLMPHSIGGGDIKLLLIWSLFVTTKDMLWLLLFASISGIIFAISTSILLNKKITKLPFVPFLTIGLIAVTLFIK